jgi:hypothetical protein
VLFALIAMLALSMPVAAQAQEVPSVTVRATRDPVDKSYRKMIAGMDLFEQRHALAPQATLRFQLLPRLPRTTLDDVTLRIAGDSLTLPVATDPDHTFTLPRNAQAWQEDAALIANRKTTSLTWRVQVRSPGVPPGLRRLGDLRLECLVGVKAGLVSNNSAWFAWLGCRSPCCTRAARRHRIRCPSAIARCCWTAATTRRSGTAAGLTIPCCPSTT